MSRPGIATVGVAPLRRGPEHAAEQVTQVLLGETFAIEEDAESDGAPWWRVRLDQDGYVGWLRAWYGSEAPAKDSPAAARVDGALAEVRSAPKRSAPAMALVPWQGRLPVEERQGSWTRVRLPEGERGYVRSTSLASGTAPGGPATPSRILRTARRWLGSPYLWGGRTPAGFDCSGLVQAVWAWHGVPLPRDARDQHRWVAERARRRPHKRPYGGLPAWRAGDLLFFGESEPRISHVAIAAGPEEILHAYGRVHAGRLGQNAESYAAQLFTRFIGAWPVRFATPAAAESGRRALDRAGARS